MVVQPVIDQSAVLVLQILIDLPGAVVGDVSSPWPVIGRKHRENRSTPARVAELGFTEQTRKRGRRVMGMNYPSHQRHQPDKR